MPPKRKPTQEPAAQPAGEAAPRTEEESRGEDEQPDSAPSDQHKRRKVELPAAAEAVRMYDYEFDWSQLSGLMDEGVEQLTGVDPAVHVIDEPVNEELVRAGVELLNSLVEGAACGPWHEDVEAGRSRTAQFAESAPDMEGAVMRVYRASSPAEQESNRFELTFLSCGDEATYVFVLDKANRRFVFVGEAGAHPHCATNDFVYLNSDGSGPGLFPDPTLPPTPPTLLAAAKQRFSEYSLDHYH